MDLQPYYAKRKQGKIKSKGEENCFCLCQHHSIKAAFSFPAAVILLLSCVLSLPLTPFPPPYFALDKHRKSSASNLQHSPSPPVSHSHILLLAGAAQGPPNENAAALCCALDKSLLPGFQGKTLFGPESLLCRWCIKDNELGKLKGNTRCCWVIFNCSTNSPRCLFRAGSDLLGIFFQGFRKEEETPFSSAAAFPNCLNTHLNHLIFFCISKTST